MWIMSSQLSLLIAAGAAAASVGFAAVAQAEPDGRVCRDAGSALCHKPGPPTSSSGPEPALQQGLGANLPAPVPPLIAIG
jgi:hypothetical protein